MNNVQQSGNGPGSASRFWKNIFFYLSITLVSLIVLHVFDDGATKKRHKKVEASARFLDETGSMTPGFAGDMNELLNATFRETGADIRFLIVNTLNGQTLENYAVTQARNRGIGAESGERGMLVVYDVVDQRMRIEVGPRLEGIITDAFVSYLERENARSYANAHQLGLGLILTEHLIVWRLRNAELHMEYDPRPARMIADRKLLAEGAGASASLDGTSPGDGIINRRTTPGILKKYGPQPSVEAAWQKYQEWLLEPFEYTNVPLFTADTQQMLASLNMSRAFFDSIFMHEYAQPHKVIEVGNVAMLYFTHTPLVSPYYFLRTDEGWKLDIEGSIRNSQELVGSPFTWRWRDGHDQYSKMFLAYTVTIDGVDRIDGGDNRPLPVHDDVLHAAAAKRD
ncbi:MAG TPA: TPM domain-containing protein [Gammaproteobacteria bacterium]